MAERYYRKHEIMKIIEACSANLRYVDSPPEGWGNMRKWKYEGIKELELALVRDFDTIVEDLRIRKPKE